MNKWINIKQFKGKYFIKIYKLFLAAIIPLFIISSIAYINIKSSFDNASKQLSLTSLDNVVKNLSNEYNEIERMAYLIKKNYNIYLSPKDFVPSNQLEISNFLEFLSSTITIKESADEVALISQGKGIVLSSQGYYDLDFYFNSAKVYNGIEPDYWEKLSEDKYRFVTLGAVEVYKRNLWENEQPSKKVIPLFFSSKYNSGLIALDTLFTLKESSIADMLNQNNLFKDGKLLVLNEQDEFVSCSDPDFRIKDLEASGLNDAGYKDYDGKALIVEDTGYLVYSRKVPELNWRVINFIPKSSYYNNSRVVLNIFIYTNILILLLGITAAYYMSMGIYRPIGNLVKMLNDTEKAEKFAVSDEIEFIKSTFSNVQLSNQSLVKRYNAIEPYLQENVIKNLFLYGDDSVNEKEIQDIINGNISKLDKKYFFLAICYIEFNDLFRESFAVKEQMNLSNGVSSVIKNLLMSKFQSSTTIDLDSKKFFTVINTDNPNIHEEYKEFVHSVQDILSYDKNYVKLFFYTSETEERLISLANHLRSGLKTLGSVNILGEDGIVNAWDTISSNKVLLPPNLSEKLSSRLKSKMYGEINELIDTIFYANFNKERVPDKLKRFYAEIFEATEGILKRNNIDTGFLNEYRNNKAVKQLDFHMAKKLLKEMLSKISLNDNVIEKKYSLTKYIEENYSNQNLSLEVMANDLNLNPAYLSRLFKEQTGNNFNSFLTELRVGKAKELLLNTEYSIGEISELVGISNRSTFNRVFSKYTGVAPLAFRIANKS